MLTLTNVRKTFNKGTINEKKALNGIDLHLDPGDFVTIIGGNGAGKSTMLNMIAGVYPIDSGKIVIDGVNISREPEYKRAKYIGRVFQDPMMGTAAGMEIQENLALAFRRGQKRGLGWGIKSEEKEFYYDLLFRYIKKYYRNTFTELKKSIKDLCIDFTLDDFKPYHKYLLFFINAIDKKCFLIAILYVKLLTILYNFCKLIKYFFTTKLNFTC